MEIKPPPLKRGIRDVLLPYDADETPAMLMNMETYKNLVTGVAVEVYLKMQDEKKWWQIWK